VRKCRVLRRTEKWILKSEKSVNIASKTEGKEQVSEWWMLLLFFAASFHLGGLIRGGLCIKSSLTTVVAIALHLQLKIAFQLCAFFSFCARKCCVQRWMEKAAFQVWKGMVILRVKWRGKRQVSMWWTMLLLFFASSFHVGGVMRGGFLLS
jgi:hypothetical protein